MRAVPDRDVDSGTLRPNQSIADSSPRSPCSPRDALREHTFACRTESGRSGRTTVRGGGRIITEALSPRSRLARRRARPDRAPAPRRPPLPPRRARRHAPPRRARSTAPSATARLAGVAATFAAGLYPAAGAAPSSRTCPASCSPGPGRSCAACGPRPSRTAGIPQEQHVFLWFLAVDPAPPARRRRPGPARARVRGGARRPSTSTPRTRPTSPTTRASASRRSAAAALPRGATHVVHEASLRRCASGRPSSFFSVLFSIWRMRSRVTPNARPTSSSVRALWPCEPVAHLDHLALARGQRLERPAHVLAAQVLRGQLERRLGRLVLDEVAQLGVLLLADRLLERHRQLRDAQDVLDLARGPLQLERRSPRGSARGRTPGRAGARRARPCSASRPCAPGCGWCGPCRRSRASRPGGSTRWRRSRTCSRGGSRTSRRRGSARATPPGSGRGTTGRGPGSPWRSRRRGAGWPRSSAAWRPCRRARCAWRATTSSSAVSRSTRPIERR